MPSNADPGLLGRLVDAIPVLISYIDARRTYQLVNRTYEEWFGVRREEVVGQSMEAVLGSAAYADLSPFVDRVLAGERVSFERNVHYRTGGTRRISATYVPDRDGGVVHGFYVLVEDVTAQRAAEAAAAAERQAMVAKLEAVLEVLPVGVGIAEDPDCKVIRANAELARIMGATQKKNVSMIAEPEERPAVRVLSRGREMQPDELPIQVAARTGRAVPVEKYVIERGDGSSVVITGAAVPLQDAAGGVIGAVGSFTDITEMERAAAAMAQREALLRGIGDAVPGFLWSARPDGSVEYANARYQAVLDQHPPETHASLIHPDDLPHVQKAFGEAAAQGRAVDVEYRHFVDGAEPRWVLVTARPERDSEGRICRWVALGLDVTERKRAEEELRRARQMQAVATLAGGVAHEINNQMSVVLGFGELALTRLAEHRARPLVGHMMEAGRRAAGVTQQLLAFSRRQVLSPVLFDPDALLREFLPVVERLLGADKLVRFEPSGAGALVRADRGQLEQVLVNLVANSRDAMRPGGTLTLRVEAAGDEVALCVADDGAGMPPDVLARVFEPFFTTKPVGAGTGLGLPMVHGIVTQSGGRLKIESRPGLGTTVRVLLPVASEDARAASASPARRRPSHAGLVVVAEDEPRLRELIVHVLREAGFRVLSAGNGYDAIRLLEELREPPRLVVTDVVMPGANGGEIKAAARRKWPVPVLYLSGYPREEMVQRGLVAADEPLLQKPFAPDRLLAEIARVLDDAEISTPRSS